MNHVVLTGNIGADPEISFSSDGVPWATFSLAFQSSKKKTSWIKVVAFNKLADVVQSYLHKGARIGVFGSLEMSRWQNDKGEKKQNFKVIASNIEFIKTDGRGFANGQPTDEVPF